MLEHGFTLTIIVRRLVSHIVHEARRLEREDLVGFDGVVLLQTGPVLSGINY